MYVFGIFAFGYLAFFTLFTAPVTDADETGLFNPVYVFLQTGRMAYPIYYDFDAMFVHPPVHYLEIGLLMRTGIPLQIAEGIPSLLFTALVLITICYSRFSFATRLGSIYGFVAGLVFFLTQPSVSLHQLRPDIHVALAWFAGLVLLESGRMADWELRRMALGSFLLTYASGLHYFAAAACLGVGVYIVWGLAVLCRPRALRLGAALIGAGLAFGVPYLLLFVIPDWDGIRSITSAVQGSGGVPEAVARHLAQYRYTLAAIGPEMGPLGILGLPVRAPMALGIPLVCLGPVVLMLFRDTRGLGLASIPLPALVLLYSQGKSAGYYVPELILYFSAFGVLVLTAAGFASRNRGKLLSVTHIVTVVGAAWGFLVARPLLMPTGLSSPLDPHPMEVARAAGVSIMGSGAHLAGRIGGWYVSGASEWRELETDLLWRALPVLSPTSYFAHFDAIADQYDGSDVTLNVDHQTLSSWYLEGVLHARGFYFADTKPNSLSYLLMSAEAPAQLSGYAYMEGSLQYFGANPDGSALFATYECPRNTAPSLARAGVAANEILISPTYTPGGGQQGVVMLLADTATAPPLATIVPDTCTIREEERGNLLPVAQTQFLANLHQQDVPMRFDMLPPRPPDADLPP